ncbi:MAG: glycosyltransferase family 4 protein [Verrucomicrobiota bacterium]
MNEENEEPPRLVLVGQLPPPFHGQAVATKLLAESRWEGLETKVVRMDFSEEIDEVGSFKLGKLFKLMSLLGKTLAARRRGGHNVLYYPPAGPDTVPVLRDIVFLFLVRPFFRQTVFHFHAGGLPVYLRKKGIVQKLARFVYRRPSVCIELFRKPKEERVAPVIGGKEVVVTNGVEGPPDGLTPERGARRKIAYLGALNEGKGIIELIQTAAAMAQPDVYFEVAGSWSSAEFEKAAKEAVAKKGLGDKVRFVGEVRDEAKWKFLLGADVFFFPSHYERENLPLVVIEAMACGLPVVATRWRGIPSLLDGCPHARVLDPGDIDGFALALSEILADDQLLEEAAREDIRSFYRGRYTVEKFREGVNGAILEAVQSDRA